MWPKLNSGQNTQKSRHNAIHHYQAESSVSGRLGNQFGTEVIWESRMNHQFTDAVRLLFYKYIGVYMNDGTALPND